MAKGFIELELPETTVKVELQSMEVGGPKLGTGRVEAVGPTLEAATGKIRMEEILKIVRGMAELLRDEVRHRVPELSTVELSFGIRLEGGAELWIASATAEANFTVRLMLSTESKS